MIGISNKTMEKVIRLLLRSTPFVAAPALLDLYEVLTKSNRAINEKIDKAYQSLKETSVLIDDLHNELTERTEKVHHLRDEYERYSKLARIEEDKIKPLLVEMDKTVNKGKGYERWISFCINIIAGLILFYLGIWLGPKITQKINGTPKTEIEQTINK